MTEFVFARRARKSRAQNISEAERPSVKMALRVGGGTRSATFENQSVFFRKESTRYMSSENEPSVSSSALRRRERFAKSFIGDLLCPVDYTDPYNSIERLREHLGSGNRAVVISTHPSIEDALRVMRILFQMEGVSDSVIGGPAAIHQERIVKLITRPFDVHTSYVVTQHTKDKAKERGEKIPWAYEKELLQVYQDFIINTLGPKSLLGATLQADQDEKLKPPKKPVVGFILKTMQDNDIFNVLYVPMGIEIHGIHDDYSKVRNISVARHRYTFHLGPSFLDTELQDLAKAEGVTPDFVMYEQLRLVSPRGYLLKQPNLP